MKFVSISLACAALAGLSTAAQADAVFDEFGELPGVEFGGDGILNDRVAISRATAGNQELTLGLTATPRFENPKPGLASDGVFTVEPGLNNGNPGQPGNRSSWNFSFYADIADGVDYVLLYDFDPTNDTDYGRLEIENFAVDGAYQGSQNPAFDYLTMNIPTLVTPPSMAFDAEMDGIYNFRLQAFLGGSLLTESAIDVIVGAGAQDVPAPGALGLLGLGGLALAASRRRRSARG